MMYPGEAIAVGIAKQTAFWGTWMTGRSPHVAVACANNSRPNTRNMTSQTTDDPHRVNNDIQNRIADIDEQGLQEFLEAVVSYERRNLHLSEPHYQDQYRSYAEQCFDINVEASGEDTTAIWR